MVRLVIRKHRKNKGLRLVELARRLGVSKSLMSEIELGTVGVSAFRLWDIAQELEVPVQDLYELEEEPATAP